MSKVGEIIRRARESVGLNQGQLAAKIRHLAGDTFSRAALSQIESGKTKNPKPQNLQAACDALGIDFRGALSGKLVWITQGSHKLATRIESGSSDYSIEMATDTAPAAPPIEDEPQSPRIGKTAILIDVLRHLDAYEHKYDIRFNRKQKAHAILDLYDYLATCTRNTRKAQEQIERILASAGDVDGQD